MCKRLSRGEGSKNAQRRHVVVTKCLLRTAAVEGRSADVLAAGRSVFYAAAKFRRSLVSCVSVSRPIVEIPNGFVCHLPPRTEDSSVPQAPDRQTSPASEFFFQHHE